MSTVQLNPGYIYKITRNSDGKVYVGQTRQNPNRRSRMNGDNFSHGYGVSKIGKALTKYGWSAFTHEVIETIDAISDLNLDQLEAKYIKQYNSLDRNKGFNTKSFQEGGQEYYTQEVRDNMSKIKTGVSVNSPAWNRGITMTSPDGKELHNCPKCQSWKTEDAFSPMNRKTQTGKDVPRKTNYWCKSCNADNMRKYRKKNEAPKLSKEALQESYKARKQAMSEGAKRAYANDPTLKERASKARSKSIVAKDPTTGEIVHRFSSGIEAKKAGFNNVTVSEAIKKGIVRLGFKWEFEV